MSVATVAAEVKVGDIFVSEWGYDQTNVDYYEVVGLTPSGKSVRVRKVAKTTVGSTGYSDSVVPRKGEYVGKEMTKRLRNGYGGPAFYLTSYADAYRWDGKPTNQTGFGFGH